MTRYNGICSDEFFLLAKKRLHNFISKIDSVIYSSNIVDNSCIKPKESYHYTINREIDSCYLISVIFYLMKLLTKEMHLTNIISNRFSDVKSNYKVIKD